jgi:signal transduction histidine kinase
MIIAPIPANDDQRIEELYRYEILDTPYEEEFDDIVKLASRICNTPISLITLVEKSRQWFKAKIGIDSSETSRDVSFCSHSLDMHTDLLMVEDATQDERFHDNPFVVEDPKIKFYAGVPLVSSNGYKLGTLCVINSIPQLLTAEQSFALKVLADQVMKMLELRIRNKQLQNAHKRQLQQSELHNKIISIIAHDVRNPVASIKNIMDLAKSNILTEEEAKELMLMAEDQLDGTIKLLADLLDWGRMQINAQSNAEPEKIHLHGLVIEKLEALQVNAALKGNILYNFVKEDIFVLAEKNALGFIVRNLLSNAMKFTSGGSISVYAHTEGSKLSIKVADTGVGMNEQTRARLFDGKGSMSTNLGTNNEKGSGLGLMLTKDFVELLGGHIYVESELGKGTDVILELKA